MQKARLVNKKEVEHEMPLVDFLIYDKQDNILYTYIYLFGDEENHVLQMCLSDDDGNCRSDFIFEELNVKKYIYMISNS